MVIVVPSASPSVVIVPSHATTSPSSPATPGSALLKPARSPSVGPVRISDVSQNVEAPPEGEVQEEGKRRRRRRKFVKHDRTNSASRDRPKRPGSRSHTRETIRNHLTDVKVNNDVPATPYEMRRALAPDTKGLFQFLYEDNKAGKPDIFREIVDITEEEMKARFNIDHTGRVVRGRRRPSARSGSSSSSLSATWESIGPGFTTMGDDLEDDYVVLDYGEEKKREKRSGPARKRPSAAERFGNLCKDIRRVLKKGTDTKETVANIETDLKVVIADFKSGKNTGTVSFTGNAFCGDIASSSYGRKIFHGVAKFYDIQTFSKDGVLHIRQPRHVRTVSKLFDMKLLSEFC